MRQEPASGRTRVGEVVLRAAGLDGADREAYLEEIALADPAVAGEARERLAAAQDLSSFLERPAADLLGAVDADAAGPALAEPPAALLDPEERYELGRCLGEGGMGRVMEAHDRQLGRRVALKLLTDGRARVHDAFLREGRAQARVRHDHVLDVYDAGRLRGQPFLSMRHVAGGTLAEVAPRLSLEHRIRLLIQVAEGLHAAHREGLLHRDVKPSNVLVEEGPDGELSALVSDFGVATDVEDPAWLAGEAAGTPHFMAPECLVGTPEAVDRRADVYSLGVTMYQVFAGALPFSGPLTLDVLRQAAREEPPPPSAGNPNLPAEVEAIILRCMARDPGERYASARAVAEDLQRFLDGEVVEAYAAGLAYRLTRFVLRNRLLVAMAAAAAAALVVASVAVAVFALRADAARKRAELRQGQAEELIRFMVVDLQEKLEPVSRLTVLDDVAKAATEYFAAVPEEELSEVELLRRSRMLYQLGNLRIQEGDLEAAAAPLEESLALTRRLHEIAPEDPERLFELGQSWFWVGFVAWERGDLAAARGAFEEYLAVSRRLGEMDPQDLDWQLELSYATSNLGSVLQAEGRFEEALGRFEESLAIKERLVRAAPGRTPWRSDLADSLNTVGVALFLLDRIDEARRHFERELALREALVVDQPENQRLRSALATAYTYLGKTLAETGELERAKEHAEAGRNLLLQLTAHDPDNVAFRNKLVWAHVDLGRFAYEVGDVAGAEREWRAARVIVDRFLAGVEAGEPLPDVWRRARGVLAYHVALVHFARGDPRAGAEARSAVEILGNLAAELPEDSETARWLDWSRFFLDRLESLRPGALGCPEEAGPGGGGNAGAAGQIPPDPLLCRAVALR